ncbi:hypothetical protein [Achromobacter denitrificans]|uniref:Uncharacterized protein n=1 Tax=Achromobacter denitrificans TaxID=32002 RepID=A0A6N0JJD5_ACHDE|nr:hypothetical protein [Achromobacter denitrificans]QKQ46796.1 hypothetical protein FOC81_08860 [Achromobacter denitrificans]
MGAIQSFERMGDDPSRTASPGSLPNEYDGDVPTVSRAFAVASVRACLSNQTAGAFGLSARIWGESLLNALADNQAGAALVILAADACPRIQSFVQDELEAYIEKTANRLLAEMDPDEAEACL